MQSKRAMDGNYSTEISIINCISSLAELLIWNKNLSMSISGEVFSKEEIWISVCKLD